VVLEAPAHAIELASEVTQCSLEGGRRRFGLRATRDPLTEQRNDDLEAQCTALQAPAFELAADRRRHQTVRSASVGDRRAARIAGSSPAIAPIAIAAPRPPAQAETGITIAQCLVVA